MTCLLPELSFAYGEPASTGVIKKFPADFVVKEKLAFDPVGEGQHQWLLIQKSGLNTHEVAVALAELAGIPHRDVGYSGLKDKQAITTQWFSVDLAGKTPPDWYSFQSEQIQVMRCVQGGRKLRRGAHSANHFEIIVRDFGGDRVDLEKRAKYIETRGVPNYFGPQRFGREGNNIRHAYDMFSHGRRIPRHKRSIYLSAARSLIFNDTLSGRVADHTWLVPRPGDVMMLEGSKQFFHCENVDEEIFRRVSQVDISPSGPLWGTGQPQSSSGVAEFEIDVANQYDVLRNGLAAAGLKQQRRSLRLRVTDFEWHFSEDMLVLRFELPSGGFATSVLRELANCAESR